MVEMGFELRPSGFDTHFFYALLHCLKSVHLGLGDRLVRKALAGQKEVEFASQHLCKKLSTPITPA